MEILSIIYFSLFAFILTISFDFEQTKTRPGIPIDRTKVLKEEVDLYFQVGMVDFIGKPFDTDELLYKIHNLKTKTNEK